MSLTLDFDRPLIPLDAARLEDSLREHVAASDFPCVGAKSALAKGTLQIEPAWSLVSAWDDLRIHRRLLEWSADYSRDPQGLRSFAVVFSEPGDLSERAFERAMWERLQSLSDKDGWIGHPYDDSVSSDPDDPHFSLSFGKQAYFVVGMHPNASRPARRTPHPTLVFNLHDQFEQLRAANRYERMRERILARDEELAGSINPMLARHGEGSEARQYSGRQVDEDWQCPFRDPRSA
ncbi:guanitoxin biosynthesis heme-dependent pre-guanitoxin N-hydroxylase GntA [Pelagerythrobacter marinus]|jgi:FPC/CPF motif-containing protein YcgG|uniref:guanitoxin biosynthesis heme-dependent pre-guanitoxin N-hydroxylase GntA n=1 Tax=Pelagerythrobacter marinus TaxID=538382 RepID=UPI002036AD10|nr:guanitoxin biosynthesis heme-dependent pre-guanitoxin N-hydroxylase GntA [Pelagerythrobacter marinus]USA39794.1 YqcI/YcgG family protein [Pelagerythrobacter marinus]WPZ06075.1 guanitoxin biosynthesis heme-dependent pre-guanitoxin N-hydroxylase GntA [Pelagerythrobacter marinus]